MLGRVKLPFALVLLLLSRLLLRASGEEVVVVYNAKSAESKALADYYAMKRGVPKAQVFGFDLPTTETISRADFRDALEQPLAKKLEAEKLWRIGTLETTGTNGQTLRYERRVVESRIRYLVLCYGVPLKILRDATLQEPEEIKMRPEFRRNEAAVDSELTCLPLHHQHPALAGVIANPVYATTNAAFIHPTNGVLMVARLDGPTLQIARGLIDNALLGERDGLWGRAYIDLRNASDPNMKQGDDWLRTAAEVCKHVGFETTVDEGGAQFPLGFPMSHVGFYAGWYSENMIGALSAPAVEFMPGAFAYHLHSFSAASLRITNHNWVGPLLAKGVTATMGTVDEPYLGGTPDIGTFAARFLYFGMTFGESACAAQNVLSWQTTVVGDPLYRPLGRSPKALHEDLEARHSPLIEWSYLRLASINMARKAPVGEIVALIESWSVTRRSAVLTEKLAELYTAQGKPSSAVQALEQALKLSPSIQQRVRLRLDLGDKLMKLGREESALDDFQKLLAENPSHPDRLEICRKALGLARKLGKKELAAKYEEQIGLLSNTPPPKQ